MEMTISYRAPEPGQLEDGECFAQPFYCIWGGDDQPLVPGIFDGVGETARDAYEDAVLSIERHLISEEGPENTVELMHAAHDMAVHDIVFLPAGGPFVCTLTFTL
jgi:hypothetical protein